MRVVPFIVSDLVSAGFTIVSGMASGVDELAHRAALEYGVNKSGVSKCGAIVAGAKTIAVFGTGVDERSIFPKKNLGLSRDIIDSGGALISEYAPGTGGTRYGFPLRNRIISGMSRGVLVVEAGEKSGALITARSALDQNRDVFAVPGEIFGATSAGVNRLIQQGAKLVTSGSDILEEYGIELQDVMDGIVGDNPEQEKIIFLLKKGPLEIDEIICETKLDTAKVISEITIMEVDKKINALDARLVRANRYLN